MRIYPFVAPLLVLSGLVDAAPPVRPSFSFNGTAYFHRWSKNDQHEFTPEGQEDLEKWSDMITMNLYPDAHDGDALAAKANAVLENYKNHQGTLLKTDSVPRTPQKPAEHFIAVVFGRPEFIEAAFARFKLIDGAGCSIVYSHRIYGQKIGEKMSTWLGGSGAQIENALMDWKDMPSPASLRTAVARSQLRSANARYRVTSRRGVEAHLQL